MDFAASEASQTYDPVFSLRVDHVLEATHRYLAEEQVEIADHLCLSPEQ